jgi:predicted flavoprotein YhiN
MCSKNYSCQGDDIKTVKQGETCNRYNKATINSYKFLARKLYGHGLIFGDVGLDGSIILKCSMYIDETELRM